MPDDLRRELLLPLGRTSQWPLGAPLTPRCLSAPDRPPELEFLTAAGFELVLVTGVVGTVGCVLVTAETEVVMEMYRHEPLDLSGKHWEPEKS